MRATLDGFRSSSKDAFVGYDPSAARRFTRAMEWLSERLHVEVRGIERIPAGRAVIVTNHAFGFDAAFAITRIAHVTGRRVWMLGEHRWWSVPGIRRLAAAVGTVDGTPANVDRLLEKDELVMVLPGGLREAMKPHALRYRLLWGHRYGFVRAALRNGAPIVPMASLGADDVFSLAGDAYARARRLHLPFPFPWPTRLFALPRRVSLRYVIGEPIPMEHPPQAESDAHVVRRLRREVEGAIHELFEEGLALDASFPIERPAHAR